MICKRSLLCILDPVDYLCDLNHSIRTKVFHSVAVLDCRKHSQLPWSSSLHMRWLSQSPSFWKHVSRGWSPALRGSSLLADSFLKIKQTEINFHKFLTITFVLILWWLMNTCSEENLYTNSTRWAIETIFLAILIDNFFNPAKSQKLPHWSQH